MFEVAADANGVTYAPTAPIAAPTPDGSTSTSSGGSGGQNSAGVRLTAGSTIAVVAGFLFGLAFVA